MWGETHGQSAQRRHRSVFSRHDGIFRPIGRSFRSGLGRVSGPPVPRLPPQPKNTSGGPCSPYRRDEFRLLATIPQASLHERATIKMLTPGNETRHFPFTVWMRGLKWAAIARVSVAHTRSPFLRRRFFGASLDWFPGWLTTRMCGSSST